MKSNIFALLILSLVTTHPANAQPASINREMEDRIDAIFEEWNSSTSPGASIGILSNNEIIYLKAFGTENLSNKNSITPDTRFRIGGKAQHFTAFAILLLEDQSKLSLDDDIRQYLPFLPEYDVKITIHNLLSHSSGLPDYWTLKALSGFSEQNAFTIDDAKEFYSKKWTLSNKPGEQYTFSGTGGFLMAQIVEQVSGMTFTEFTQKEMFEPLGMINTFFVENLMTESSLLSTPYSLEGELFQSQVIGNVVPGPANLATSTSDLMKWYQNLSNPTLGSRTMMEKLDTRIEYKPGHFSHSPNGWLTYGQQFDHFERSLKSIWDFGALGGFAASVFRFTDNDNLTIVVLSNNGLTYNGFLGMQTAEVFLENEFDNSDWFGEPLTFIPLNDQIKDRFLGDYFDTDEFFQRQIILRDDTLRYYRPNQDTENALVPISQNEVAMISPFGVNILKRYDHEGKERLEFVTEDASFFFEKYDPFTYSEAELKGFEGIFYSDKLSISYSIFLKNGALFIRNNRVGEFALSQFKEDEFSVNTNYFNQVFFERDSSGKVISLTLSAASLKELRFRRI